MTELSKWIVIILKCIYYVVSEPVERPSLVNCKKDD